MKKIFSVLISGGPQLSYSCINFNISIGDLVIVPVRDRKVVGVVLDQVEQVANYQLKDIIDILPFKLGKDIINFINEASKNYLINKGSIAKMIFGIVAKRHKIIIKKHIEKNKPFVGNDIQLSSEQQSVFEKIVEAKDGVYVIDGVTGSGKTELYLKIAKTIVEKGGQVLILLPEILLTTQIIERARKFFQIASWHSNVKLKDKDLIWLGTEGGLTKVVIGARSALFLPFSNLKMIIVDEEHDSSFKQETSPIYHGRDLAILRGKILKIPVVLTSATPSIETIYNVEKGNYKYFHLNKSYSDKAKTHITVANMWDCYDKTSKTCSLLHPISLSKLKTTLDNKKQSIVFLNRKGYGMTTICSKCMTVIKCKNCDVKLTYYKYKNYMKCRHCRYIIREISACTICGSKDTIFSYQPGIEKLHEEIVTHLPNARTLVVTRDSEEAPEDIVNSIANSNCDIIIGTQILAKGLHFPNMDLAIIVDANNLRFSGDIRSFEKTYQIIQQVIGRVGRERHGEAVIQTFTPNSPLIKAIASGNKREFIALELQGRKNAKVPPYSRFVLVNIAASNEVKLLNWLKSIDIPISNEELKVFGPIQAPIGRLHSKYRQQILFRGEENLVQTISGWLENIKVPSFIKLTVDIDPINFL